MAYCIYTPEEVLKHVADASPHYSANDVRGLFSLFLKTVTFLHQIGGHIHLPFLKITNSIGGKFTGQQDSFAPQPPSGARGIPVSKGQTCLHFF
ncbi:MAG: hypothetical protein RIG62_27475 [Cyclobacteriaceae bacterium]